MAIIGPSETALTQQSFKGVIMSFKMSLPVVVALAAMPMQSIAAQCSTGSSPVTVSGRVTTQNLSTTKQVGQICLTLVAPDGREVFDDCGALLGKVTSMDPDTGTSTLDHTAVFEHRHSFHTVNDTAQITGVLAVDEAGVPCKMAVLEHITNLKWGTGIFNKATLDVWANGSVSSCPGKNLNSFQLNGQACIRNNHLR